MLPLAGAVLGVIAMAILGFPGDALLGVAIPAAAAVVVWLLFYGIPLWWAWFKAPMRLLTDDVLAIREKLEDMSAPAEEPREPMTTTLTLRNQVRLGRELLQTGASGQTERRLIREWVDGVVEALGRSIPEDLEGFLTQPDAESKVAELEAIAQRHTPYRTTATLRAGPAEA